MVEKHIHLFIGEDGVSKDRKISALKKEILENKSQSFDYELLYADSLDSFKLKELLDSLPVFSQKKIIVIKKIDKVSLPNKKILLSFAKNPNKNILLILDSDKPELEDDFLRKISALAKVFNFRSTPQLNVFDLGRALAGKRTVEALLCLSGLLKNGEKQANILGVIGWQWRKLKRNLPAQEFKRGLELLQKTDYSIKRSRLKGDLALELLVVKLCAPASC